MTIQIGSHLVDANEFTRTLRITVVDKSTPPRSGIGQVRIVDVDGALVREEDFSLDDRPEPPCPRSVTLTVTVTRSELPIVVHATTCDEETSESKEIDVDPPRPSRPNADGLDVNPALPCSPLFCPENASCSEAQVELVMKGNEIRRLCDRANRLRGTWIEYATLTIVLSVIFAALVAAVVAAISAGPWGAIPALILSSAAAVVLASATISTARALEAREDLDRAERDLRTARHQFDAIYATVSSECCPGCADNEIVFQPEC